MRKNLRKFNSYDVTSPKTPYDSSVKLKKNQGTCVSQEEYAKIIENRMFLMNYTLTIQVETIGMHKDLIYLFAMNRLNHYTQSSGGDHWNALKEVL